MSNFFRVLIASMIILIGLILFKYIPMWNYGSDILFDASAHIAITIFILYLGWFFVNKTQKSRIIYLEICFLVLVLIGIQRIEVMEHNFIGVVKGAVIGIIGILIANFEKIRHWF
jgi:hypothetical protein